MTELTALNELAFVSRDSAEIERQLVTAPNWRSLTGIQRKRNASSWGTGGAEGARRA